LIGTVRNVGYKAIRPVRGRLPAAGPGSTGDEDEAEGSAVEPNGLPTPLSTPLASQ
jgi:hypothetical protein